MKHLLVLCLFFSCTISTSIAFGQNRMPVDQGSGISADGNYIFQTNRTNSRDGVNEVSVSLQSTRNNFNLTISGVNQIMFSNDSQGLLYVRSDTLFYYRILENKIERLGNFLSFQGSTIGHYVVATSSTSKADIVLINLLTLQKTEFRNVIRFEFEPSGAGLMMTTKNEQNIYSLLIYEMSVQNTAILWSKQGVQIKNALRAKDGLSIYFVTETDDSAKLKSIWQYSMNFRSAKLLLDDTSCFQRSGYRLSTESLTLNSKSNVLFFRVLEMVPDPTANTEGPSVDVWSYLDPKIKTQEFKQPRFKKRIAAYSILNDSFLVIENENEVLLTRKLDLVGERVVVAHFPADILTYSSDGEVSEAYSLNEYNWSRFTQPRIEIVSLNTSNRKTIFKSLKLSGGFFPYFTPTPDGAHFIFFDSSNYYLLNSKTGLVKNLTHSLKNIWTISDPDIAATRYFKPLGGVLSWREDGKSFLVYDKYYDLWSISLQDAKLSVNLTAGTAKKLKASFLPIGLGKQYSATDLIYVQSLNYPQLGESIWKISLGGAFSPACISKGKIKYSNILRAKNAIMFLVTTQSVSQPMSVSWTADFQKLYPLNSVLKRKGTMIDKSIIQWSVNGSLMTGIMYKPRDFDPKKKYPVIFYYYDKEATLHLNSFETYIDQSISSSATGDRLNISYCLNNGYIVFVPNFYYNLGQIADNVTLGILGAVKKISTFPFIDPKRMGIQGHSFGGYQTNLIVANTSVFAAACSGSGASDLVSLYGADEKDGEGFSYSANVETGQFRTGVLMWDRPDIYIKNSPVFNAHKVSTPLLLMSNKNDHRVPFAQGVEFFKALRRLGKKVWLLQYDQGAHSVGGEVAAADYGRRMMQFFDHYLKGLPAPVWMTQGVTVKQKHFKLGYEYDNSLRTPGEGLLMANPNAQTPEQIRLRNMTPRKQSN